MSNRLVRVLLSMVQFVGVAAFLVAEGIQLAGPGFTDRSLTINAITYLLGVNGIVAGCGHLFFPDPWPMRPAGRGGRRGSGRWAWATWPTASPA